MNALTVFFFKLGEAILTVFIGFSLSSSFHNTFNDIEANNWAGLLAAFHD